MDHQSGPSQLLEHESDSAADARLSELRRLDMSLSNALGLNSCLKPEVALMLELYEAEREGRAMTVSVMGLINRIAPTTTLRYLEALQNKGAIRRVAHETDNRITYVELTESARAAIDQAMGVG